MILASARFAPAPVPQAATAEVLNRRLHGALDALDTWGGDVYEWAGWGRDPGRRFVSWYRHVLLRWARASVNPTSWPRGRLGTRLGTIGKMVRTLDAEADALGLRDRQRVFGQARQGMGKSGQYPRTPSGRREMDRDLNVVLLGAVLAHGSALFTIGPKGEGIGFRQVRDSIGRPSAHAAPKGLDRPDLIEGRERPLAELVEMADEVVRLQSAIDRLDAKDRYLALRWSVPGKDLAQELGVTPGRVSQRKDEVVARLRRILALS